MAKPGATNRSIEALRNVCAEAGKRASDRATTKIERRGISSYRSKTGVLAGRFFSDCTIRILLEYFPNTSRILPPGRVILNLSDCHSFKTLSCMDNHCR